MLVRRRARSLLDAREVVEGEVEVVAVEHELGSGIARDARAGGGGERLGREAALDR